jgi:hypothetical protein
MHYTGKPSHDWHRHHPAAKRIAAALLDHPSILDLRTRRLRADIQARYRVGACTASTAVAIARRFA